MDFESILNTIQPFVVMFAALFAAFLTATWIAAVIWAFRDIRARSRDIFAQVLATLLVLVFFPLFPVPGLLLYLILRPRETLAEVYERSLEEEVLLQGIEERLACPGCNRRIEAEFMICPTCHTRLKKACHRAAGFFTCAGTSARIAAPFRPASRPRSPLPGWRKVPIPRRRSDGKRKPFRCRLNKTQRANRSLAKARRTGVRPPLLFHRSRQ